MGSSKDQPENRDSEYQASNEHSSSFSLGSYTDVISKEKQTAEVQANQTLLTNHRKVTKLPACMNVCQYVQNLD